MKPCPVCGTDPFVAGVMIAIQLYWTIEEYLCSECFMWAHDRGAEWEGRVLHGYTGLSIPSRAKWGIEH